MSKVQIGIGAFLILLAGGAYMWWPHMAQNNPAAAAAATPVHVRWVLSHKPTDLYTNATKVFADTLLKESNGHLVLDVLQSEAVGFTGKGDIPYTQSVALLDQGKAELSTTYAVADAVADPSFGVINLPYLFKDYASASKVFDGPLGAKLLGSVSDKTTIRAMAFTYSGGYRIFASSKKNIQSLSDFKGLHVATSGGPVAEEFLRSLGAIPVSLDLESGSSSLANIDAVETTYSRLSEVVGKNSSFSKYITETKHSLFTTTIIVSDSFYNSLSVADQQALTKAVNAAAQVERQDSIALGEKTRADLAASGSTITTPSAQLQADLTKAAQTVAQKFTSVFGSDTAKNIQAAQ